MHEVDIPGRSSHMKRSGMLVEKFELTTCNSKPHSRGWQKSIFKTKIKEYFVKIIICNLKDTLTPK